MGLGYQPLSAIDRKITACPQYDKYFDKPANGKLVKKLADKNGGVEETVKQMVALVNNNYKEVERAKHLVKGATTYQTAKNIFDFLYKHIKYNLERGEILNSPAASYWFGQVKARQNPDDTDNWPVDCDDFSIFAASFLKSLGLPWAFRIASYNGTSYSHVYCVVPGKTEIIIDPVYYAFNKEKPYKKQKTFSSQNKQLSGMEIYTQGISGLSGLGSFNVNDRIIELAGGEHFSGLGFAGVDDEEAVADVALLGYLGDTLKTAKANPGAIADTYENPAQFIGMLEKAISGMNTKDEEDILNILAEQENRMLSGMGGHSLNGVFSGNEDFYIDEDYTGYEPELPGLEYHYQDGERYFTSLDGFFGRIRMFRRMAKRHRTKKYKRLLRKKPIKAARYKAKTTKRLARRSVRRVKRRKILKNAARFFNKVNPVTLVARNSLRALLALNFMNISGALVRNKKAYGKVLDLYTKMGGKSSIVAKTIAKGAKRKPMLKRKGRINMSGFEGLGVTDDLSAVLKTAGGIIKKIIGWLKERKQLKVVAKEKGISIKDARAKYKAGDIKLPPPKEKKEHKLWDKAKAFVQDQAAPQQPAQQPYVERNEGYQVDRGLPDSNNLELSAWQYAKNNIGGSDAINLFEQFIKDYPKSEHLNEARDIIKDLKQKKYKKYGIIGAALAAGAGLIYVINEKFTGKAVSAKTKQKPLKGIKLK